MPGLATGEWLALCPWFFRPCGPVYNLQADCAWHCCQGNHVHHQVRALLWNGRWGCRKQKDRLQCKSAFYSRTHAILSLPYCSSFFSLQCSILNMNMDNFKGWLACAAPNCTFLWLCDNVYLTGKTISKVSPFIKKFFLKENGILEYFSMHNKDANRRTWFSHAH